MEPYAPIPGAGPFAAAMDLFTALVADLQFEALLTAARASSNPYDFALVSMLGLLGLRIFEATGANIADLEKDTATGCCARAAMAARSS